MENLNLKRKHTLDIDREIDRPLRAVVASLYELAESGETDLDMTPVDDRQQPFVLLRGDANPYRPDYVKLRFKGTLEETIRGSTHLTGILLLDPATFISRSLYLLLLAPPMMVIALRLGWRLPLIGIVSLAVIAGLLYLTIWQPQRALVQRRETFIREIERHLATESELLQASSQKSIITDIPQLSEDEPDHHARRYSQNR